MEKQDNWLIFFELEELKHKTRTATWTNFAPLGLHSGLPGCLLDAWRLRGMRGKSFTKIGNSLCYAHTAGCFLASLLVDRAFRARLGRIRCLRPSWAPIGTLLGVFGHALGRSWETLGSSWGALGELLGGSWELLEGSWGTLGSCTS